MQAVGYGGELRVGYQRAAQFGAWRLEVVHAVPAIRFSVRARVTEADGFWITQGPLAMDLRFGRFHWAWDAVSKADISESGAAEIVVYGKPRIVKDGEV